MVQKLPNKKTLSYLEKNNFQWKVCKMDSAPTKTVKILKLIWRKVSFLPCQRLYFFDLTVTFKEPPYTSFYFCTTFISVEAQKVLTSQ